MNYSFALIISVSLLATLIIHCAANASLVQDTCKKISQKSPDVNYDFCVAAFESDPTSKTASLQQLAFISLKLGTSNATALIPRIKSLLTESKFDAYAKQCLRDCLELYSDAIDSLKDAVEDFKEGDLAKANADISAAMDGADTCESQFTEKQGEVSPLTKENGDFTQLAAISLAFTAKFP
ncbi:hypothetical protein Nepgr_024457 [Nepenthes gracilis]|uniref:Pectinesterase inhibitor domain-containing protein n=1 Tax=Nepenthes gracilis TaxID=150966 RepID=A0AAD3T4P2_NEPGR|nr:hypothetical protein Nepgr_024457 [Nepenthes gracilis]